VHQFDKNMKKDIVTAAYIIIGDEILSGRTQDANLNFLAKSLVKLGVSLKEVRVVADDENQIIEAVNILRKKYDYLFTSGGVGPTHDDITSLSIARALGQNLQQNKHALRILEEFYGKENLNESRLKMSFMPENADIIENSIMAAGGFYVNNIFVLAGIPKIFMSMFEAVKSKIIGGKQSKSLEIKTSFKESMIAKSFSDMQNKYSALSLGSYPFEGGTSLVFSGFDYDLLEKAFFETSKI
jgi:molybdenum cofactor synthesis domain-containing protein